MISNEDRLAATGDITRRTALRRVATGAGVTATTLWLNRLDLLAQDPAMHTHLAAAASAQAAAAPFTPKALTPAQLESVATLAELIIPTTNTPGARAALVDRFVDNLMANAQPADKERFLTGLAWMDTRSTALYGKPFAGATPEQQTELLTKLGGAERPGGRGRPGRAVLHGDEGDDDRGLLLDQDRTGAGAGRQRPAVQPGVRGLHAQGTPDLTWRHPTAATTSSRPCPRARVDTRRESRQARGASARSATASALNRYSVPSLMRSVRASLASRSQFLARRAM